ncbi:FAD-dependent oxidoreductase [Fretibacter rubidus]|uniref:FAD-dependent oxidoreductase n=1 Tax=Fretibacter rubidus TaxID=570162 RepID=UPI00352B7E08
MTYAAKSKALENPVIVVGGGLMGVSTLHALTESGIEAVLLEARSGVAEETSFANGGMQTPSMPDPWNGPGVGKHLLQSLFDPKSPMKLRWKAIPGLTPWGLKFLRNSSPTRHQATTMANYTLAAYSTELTEQARVDYDLKYAAANKGTLKIFESDEAMASPLRLARMLEGKGLEFKKLTTEETLDVEPQLYAIRDRLTGALQFPNDKTGDAHQFSKTLAVSAQEKGGKIKTETTVTKILVENGKVSGVEVLTGEVIRGKAVIVATGVLPSRLLAPLGLKIDIAPAKGYSFTVDATVLGNDCPHVPVIDDAMHAAVVPLGKRLRFVGTAEFAGRNTTIDKVRVENLQALFMRVYPHLAEKIDLSTGTAWTGLRPMSADGRPTIGPTPVAGLWMNIGHGHLGWTNAMGAAKLLVDQFKDETPDIDPAPFLYDR